MDLVLWMINKMVAERKSPFHCRALCGALSEPDCSSWYICQSMRNCMCLITFCWRKNSNLQDWYVPIRLSLHLNSLHQHKSGAQCSGDQKCKYRWSDPHPHIFQGLGDGARLLRTWLSVYIAEHLKNGNQELINRVYVFFSVDIYIDIKRHGIT